MQNENSRNTILFVVCSMLILGLYWIFVMQPQAEARREKAADQAANAQQAQASDQAVPATPTGAVFITDRTQALANSPRVTIRTPRLQGSLSLVGGRVDDLFLTSYRETLQADSPPVELFRPVGMEHAFFAQFGWRGANVPGGVPGPNTAWTLTNGAELTPTTPITLTWDNGQGLRFTRVVSVDDSYMFSIADTVTNTGPGSITIEPYGMVERQGRPQHLGRQPVVHEGAIGIMDGTLKLEKYGEWAKDERVDYESTGGWLGITDHYWLASIIPDQDQAVRGQLTISGDEPLEAVYRAGVQSEPVTVAPGQQVTETQRLFAGAKRAEILSAYERELGVPKFDQAIDWGMFWFLTRPIFIVLEWFYGLIGNFGLAIMALTVLVKLILFPLANKSYESLARMRKLQPMMEDIKKKHGDDPQKQQQELMALYQREKINPIAGCLPILPSIPIFYALYKVLTVTIEMRHAPFFGWIQDLSARDPSNIFTLFGLIPWDPATVPLIGQFLASSVTGQMTLGLGILAFLYGFTVWLQQAMNPPAPDPMQRRIFGLMPIMFTFIMAPFAAGLLVYWIWNNILSIIQQYVIMNRNKAENPIDTFLARFSKKAQG